MFSLCAIPSSCSKTFVGGLDLLENVGGSMSSGIEDVLEGLILYSLYSL